MAPSEQVVRSRGARGRRACRRPGASTSIASSLPTVERGRAATTAPVDRRPGAARRIVELERGAAFWRSPRLGLRAAGEDLGTGWRDERACGVAGPKGRKGARAAPAPGRWPAAPPGLPSRWPRTRPSSLGTRRDRTVLTVAGDHGISRRDLSAAAAAAGRADRRARVRAIAQAIACEIHPLNNLRVLNDLRARFGADDAIGPRTGSGTGWRKPSHRWRQCWQRTPRPAGSAMASCRGWRTRVSLRR